MSQMNKLMPTKTDIHQVQEQSLKISNPFQNVHIFNSIGTAFRSNNKIKSFPQFKFFVNCTSWVAQTFYGSSLEHVVIPAAPTNINTSPFGNCKSLKIVVFLRTTHPTTNSAFSGAASNIKLYVPDNSRNNYVSWGLGNISTANIHTFSDFLIEYPERSWWVT